MFLDLQFSLAKFLELIGDQVQRALPLVTQEFPIDSKIISGGLKVIIDHLDVTGLDLLPGTAASVTLHGPGGGSFTATTTVPRIQVSLKPALTTRQDVIAAGHLGEPALLPEGVTTLLIDIDVAAVASNGSIVLQATPVSVSDTEGFIGDSQKLSILNQLPTLSRAIDLPDVAGTTLTAVNAGLATHASGVVALLAELSAPTVASVAVWKAFFSGNFAARAGDWSMLIPKDLLVSVVDDAITDAVDALPDSDHTLEVESEPVTSWGPTGPQSIARINSLGACPVGGSSIAADLSFVVEFALGKGGLGVTVTMSWDLIDSDVFLCGLVSVFLPGLGVTVLAAIVLGPVGAVIGVVLTIAAFIAALVAISDKAHGKLGQGAGDVDPGSFDLKVTESDDEHAVFQGSAPLELTLPGMKPTAIMTTPEGLLLVGSLDVEPHVERSLKLVGESGFGWNEGYSCSAQQYQHLPVDATLTLFDPSHVPVVAQAQVLNDPSGDYSAKVSMWASVGPNGLYSPGFDVSAHVVTLPSPGNDCELLISTNSGVRYANLGHLGPQSPPPTQEELLQARLSCFRPRPTGPENWLEAHWLVDPPYDRPIERIHVWDLVVRGIAVGTPIELALVNASERPRVVTSVTMAEHGIATFRIATEPGLHLAVNARGLTAENLFVTGAGLEAVARFAPRARLIGATLVGGGPNAQVALATPSRVTVFASTGHDLGSVGVPGVQGVAALGRTIFAHDGWRVLAFDAPSPLRSLAPTPAQWRAGDRINSMQQRSRHLVVNTAGATVTLDRHLGDSDARATAQPDTWVAEPWLQIRPQQDGLIMRTGTTEAVVFRCAYTAIF
jgi:hypothetical protein